MAGERAGVGDGMDANLLAHLADLLFFEKGEGPDNGKPAAEEVLPGYHGAEIAAVQQIDEKCFDDVFLMVAKGELVGVIEAGQFKEAVAALPGTVKAAAFAVFGQQRLFADIGLFYPMFNRQTSEFVFDKCRFVAAKPHIEMDGQKFVGDWRFFSPLGEQPGKDEAVDATRDRNQYPVAVLQHIVGVHGPADQAIGFFIRNH